MRERLIYIPEGSGGQSVCGLVIGMHDKPNSADACSATDQSATHSPTQPPHAQTPDTPREHIVEFTDEAGTRRRIRYVPRTDDWWRIEETWTGCVWRHVGRELVETLQRWSRPVAGPADDDPDSP